MSASAFELQTATTSNSAELISLLQEGGYILYVRHGTTNHNEKDSLNRNFEICSNQRNLSAAGIKQTNQIGERLRALNIQVEKTWSSPFCRCKDTAENIFKNML